MSFKSFNRKQIFPLILGVMICLLHTHQAASIELGIAGRIKKPVRTFKEIKTQNVVTQNMDFSCGPAALATVLSYYFSDEVSEEEIIKYLLLTTNLEKVKRRKGFSLLDLKNFATYKGYEVVGYRMDFEFLVNLDKPVLIPVDIKDYSHFIIFRGLAGDRVFLADPALGNMTLRVERFLNLWQDGIGLVLSKAEGGNVNAPLKLTKEEKAIFADPRMVRRLFGSYPLGRIYGLDEF